MRRSILIVAGEKSGEAYGAGLVREFRVIEPSARFFGIGGKRMESEGVDILFPMDDLAVVGIVEIVSQIPRIRKIFRRIQEEVKARAPEAAVLIDSPDFNLRLAKRLKKLGVPVLYYISPTVWAWRRGRLRTIKKNVTQMLLIFPFEEAIYKNGGIPARFVGHPLLERIRIAFGREEFCRKYGLDPKRKLITLLPGSRATEIRFHLPVLVRAMEKMRREWAAQFVLVQADHLDEDFYRRFLPQELPDLTTVRRDAYEAMAAGDLVLSACGTANLEAALVGTPLVAFYRLSPLTYIFGVKLVRIKNYSIVNILAGDRIIPELIQRRFTPENLFQEAKRILASPDIQAAMKERFQKIRSSLGEAPASKNAAFELDKLLGKG
jgi:lipid-A-disaccharide synthase